MAETKRWIAMFTKHIKQKRKVYHDGFLDLEITRRKVMLYDDAHNLLESKMLKADEVVSTGETLTFQAYLVDIYDPQEGSKASSDPMVKPSDQGCVRKPFAVLKPNIKKSSIHSEDKKPNLVNPSTSKILSPSHKMIRVFKKRELHKYGALSPAIVKPTTKGTISLGAADKENNNHTFINSSFDVKICEKLFARIDLNRRTHACHVTVIAKPILNAKARSGADSRLENEKLSKEVPSHKPLRDVNEILSILKRQNDTNTFSHNNPQTSVSLTKVPPEYDTSKRHKMKSVSSNASSTDLPYARTSTSSSLTHNDPPSFDLGI